MLRFFSSNKTVDPKGQASEVVSSKDVEESVRALEDFEIELDQTTEDYVEIIDHAAPKRPRAVWKGTKEIWHQGYIVVAKDTEIPAFMKLPNGKTKFGEDVVVVEGFKDRSGNVKK